MRRSKGFTLIEVMITLAIIAILAAVALPSYNEYVRRSRISDAVAGLSTMRVRMEQYFQDNRVYNGTPAPCGLPGTSVAPVPTSANFIFNCPNVGPGTYQVTASGVGTMHEFSYSVDQNNQRKTLSVPQGWTRSETCWVLKKDGSC